MAELQKNYSGTLYIIEAYNSFFQKRMYVTSKDEDGDWGYTDSLRLARRFNCKENADNFVCKYEKNLNNFSITPIRLSIEVTE
jgi:hypothetical protein